jgi:acyl-coenzyme A thioesterase PaaI-like protein
VHGGLVATLFDEALASACFRRLPGGTGMTARLEVDYRKPVRAGQFLVLRCSVESVEGRKAWVRGRLETAREGEEATLLAEGRALYVAPKNISGLMKIRS